MTIKRTVNGVNCEFPLTKEELRAAFEEEQAAYDLDDVREGMAFYLDDHEDATEEQLTPLIPRIAERYRYLIYKNGCYADWWRIVSDAIDDILEQEEQSA